jgi:hypothetical protein
MRTRVFHHVMLMSIFLITLAEEARKTLKGMTLQQLHSKYVDLVSMGSHHYITRYYFLRFWTAAYCVSG